MFILQVHNKYRYSGGEEEVVINTIRALEDYGCTTSLFTADSKDIGNLFVEKIVALLRGIYSPSSYRAVIRFCLNHRPDIAHIHNLLPLLSPSVLLAFNNMKIPVVMTCHNYRLFCPVGGFFHHGCICTKCINGNEKWCIINNCRCNRLESIAYGVRSSAIRLIGFYWKYVSRFLVPTSFMKERFIEAGVTSSRITVMPHMVEVPNETYGDFSERNYTAYVGRISSEKGIKTLLVANHMAKLPLRIAGDHSVMPEVISLVSEESIFLGKLDRQRLAELYHGARFLIFPSECLESFGLVIAEAMSYGLPVLASKVGGVSEIIEDGVDGLLFEPGNAQDLAKKMKLLWENPRLCRNMGLRGRQKIVNNFSERVYSERLVAVYKEVLRR